MKNRVKKNIEPVDLAVDLFAKAKLVKGEGLVKTLRQQDYRGSPVTLIMIEPKIFMYLLIYEDQIYMGYNVIHPKKGKKKLGKDEIAQCAALIFTGAITTVDWLLDGDPLAKKSKKKVN